MDNATLQKTVENSGRLIAWSRQFAKRRYLFDKVAAISGEYFVGVAGMRGIGKTVMLLQLAAATENSAYFSADSAVLRRVPLYDAVDALAREGFVNVFIDEIHARPDWAESVKTLYDEHRVRLVFSGSSALRVRQTGADLSRRAVVLDMAPVSFREYLAIRKDIDAEPCTLERIVAGKRELARKYLAAAGMLDEYMRLGGTLYSGEGFREALQNSLGKIITRDLAALRSINMKYESDAYALLGHIANSRPFEFSYSSVSQKMGVSKSFLIRLLSDLQSVGLVKAVLPCGRAGAEVLKEPKVFIAIPYRHLLNPAPDVGALREEFFALHAGPACYFKTARGEKTADFRVGRHVVEVGGAGKGGSQPSDIIAADGISTEGKKVPLFLFGFLY